MILCVGRGYIGKALSEYDNFEVISHKDFLVKPLIENYQAVVNCAGITGDGKCTQVGYAETVKANVEFPLKVEEICTMAGVPFIHFTTTGISKKQVAGDLTESLAEDMPVYPHNLYCTSKILCESTLRNRNTVIFRLPWVIAPGVFESRIKNWTAVQDTYTSILEIKDLADIICKIVEKQKTDFHTYYPAKVNTFHLKTSDVYFPDFIKNNYGLDLPIRKEYPSSMTAAVPVNNSRIKERIR